MVKLETTTAYDIPEAAEILDRSESSIRKYISSGKLRAHKVGGVWYVTDKTLKEFLAVAKMRDVR